MFRMQHNKCHPDRNYLHLTSHARERLKTRGLNGALGAIAMVAYDQRIARVSLNGPRGRREEIRVDGVTIVVSEPNERGIRALITVFSEFDENGAQVYQRLRHYLEHRVLRAGGKA